MMWLLLVVALFLGYVMFKPKKATKPASGGNDGTVNVSSSPNDAVLAVSAILTTSISHSVLW